VLFLDCKYAKSCFSGLSNREGRDERGTGGEEEEEKKLFDTKTQQSWQFITLAVTEPGYQNTRRSTMLATHRIQKLLIDKTRKKTKTRLMCTSSHIQAIKHKNTQ